MPSIYESKRQKEKTLESEIELIDETMPLLDKRFDSPAENFVGDLYRIGNIRKLNLRTLLSSA
jgi:hypothetical protein